MRPMKWCRSCTAARVHLDAPTKAELSYHLAHEALRGARVALRHAREWESEGFGSAAAWNYAEAARCLVSAMIWRATARWWRGEVRNGSMVATRAEVCA